MYEEYTFAHLYHVRMYVHVWIRIQTYSKVYKHIHTTPHFAFQLSYIK